MSTGIIIGLFAKLAADRTIGYARPLAAIAFTVSTAATYLYESRRAQEVTSTDEDSSSEESDGNDSEELVESDPKAATPWYNPPRAPAVVSNSTADTPWWVVQRAPEKRAPDDDSDSEGLVDSDPKAATHRDNPPRAPAAVSISKAPAPGSEPPRAPEKMPPAVKTLDKQWKELEKKGDSASLISFIIEHDFINGEVLADFCRNPKNNLQDLYSKALGENKQKVLDFLLQERWLKDKKIDFDKVLHPIPSGKINKETLEKLCTKPILNIHPNKLIFDYIIELDYFSLNVEATLCRLIEEHKENQLTVYKRLFFNALEKNKPAVVARLMGSTWFKWQNHAFTQAEIYQRWRVHSKIELPAHWCDVKNPKLEEAYQRAQKYLSSKAEPSAGFVEEVDSETIDAIYASKKYDLMRFWKLICSVDEQMVLQNKSFIRLAGELTAPQGDPFGLHLIAAIQGCRPGIVAHLMKNPPQLNTAARAECWASIRDAKTAEILESKYVVSPPQALSTVLRSDSATYTNSDFTKTTHVKMLSKRATEDTLESALSTKSCQEDEELKKLIQSYVYAVAFLREVSLSSDYIDQIDKDRFEAISIRAAWPTNIDHRTHQLWALCCKFDAYSNDKNSLYVGLFTRSDFRRIEPSTMIATAAQHSCPNIVKDMLTVRYDAFKHHLQEKFADLLVMNNTPELLDAVIACNLTSSKEVVKALLDAGMSGVEQALAKYEKDDKKQPLVQIMREHLAAKKPNNE